MSTDTSLMNRRAVLKLIPTTAVAVGLGLGTRSSSAAATEPLDLTSPSARLRTFMLMRGALDERLVVGFVSGRYYGIVDEVMTPLFGVTAATFARYRAMPKDGSANGGFEYFSFEQAYFTDLDSGAVLSTWNNPYTGQTVTVPVTSSAPRKSIITADLSFATATPIPGFNAEHIVLPAEQIGDDVLFVEQTRAAIAVPPPGKPFHYNEIVTLRASAAELGASTANNAKRVATATTFAAVVGWRPWQQMGDRPGHLMAQGSGRYGASIDAMPKAWLEATRRLRPELLSDPGKLLDAAWNL